MSKPLGLSRRQLLKLSAGALLAAGAWPGCQATGLSSGDSKSAGRRSLKFVQVNDFHYSDDLCRPFFEQLVAQFNQIDNLDLVLVVGDLVDDGKIEQCHAIQDILKKLKVPYYTTAGNHDAATASDRSPFDTVFGKNQNQFFETLGWQFVGLDTSDFKAASNFDCHKETLDYANTLVTKIDQQKPTFLFTHFPLGPGVKNRLKNADAVLAPFKTVNLMAVFSGHYHAFTQTAVPAAKGTVIATTDRCCSRKVANHDSTLQKGYFIIEAADAAYKRTFVEYGTDFPGSAKAASAPLRPTSPLVDAPTSQPAF